MSDEVTHTPECEKARARYLALKNEYEQKWPNYCTECGGNGGVYDTYDPSPSGVSLGSGRLTDCEPCCNCTERGICPRCGCDWTKAGEESEECPTCGWQFEKPGCEGLPESPECYCWDDGEEGLEALIAILDLDKLTKKDWDYDPDLVL